MKMIVKNGYEIIRNESLPAECDRTKFTCSSLREKRVENSQFKLYYEIKFNAKS